MKLCTVGVIFLFKEKKKKKKKRKRKGKGKVKSDSGNSGIRVSNITMEEASVGARGTKEGGNRKDHVSGRCLLH